MPTSLSLSISKQNGQTKMLKNFIKIIEQLFKISEIIDNRKKLNL